jgi:hypothetical protein
MSNSAITTSRLFDHQVAGRPRPDDLARIPAPLTSTLKAELDGARSYLGVPAEEILLAALSRTIARTFGEADLAVDVNANGRFTVVLACMTSRSADATEVLQGVHRSLAAAHHGAPPSSDVFFSYSGAAPELLSDDVVPPHDVLPGLGHALEIRVCRKADSVQVDWWYDTRKFDRYTAKELTEQFPLALIDMTSDALPPVREPANLAAVWVTASTR